MNRFHLTKIIITGSVSHICNQIARILIVEVVNYVVAALLIRHRIEPLCNAICFELQV